jgi:hypothetical protein
MTVRRGVIALVALLVCVSAAAAATLSGNKAAARHDAHSLLTRVPLPPGAVRIGGASHPPELSATPARVLLGARWTVPGDYTAAYAYVMAHKPAGTTVEETGSAGNADTGQITELNVTFQWPAVPGVLGVRWLEIAVSPRAGGSTLLSASVEDVWIVPRARSERIPGGVNTVTVTVTPNGEPSRTTTTSAPATVRRAIAEIDALPIGQPGTWSCPDEVAAGSRRVMLSFLASPAGPVLATATFTDYKGWGGTSGPCNSIAFTVEGRSEAPLIGGDYMKSLRRIFGAGVV